MKEEEFKGQFPTKEEKTDLLKKINEMAHKDRILMVNKILSSVRSSTTLFVFEQPNPHVEKAAQEMLDIWIEKDYELVNEEYKVFMNKCNQNKTLNQVDGHKKKDEEKQVTSMQNNVQGEHYFDSLSGGDKDDDESSASSFEITEQWVAGVKMTGEVNSDDEVVEYDETN